MAKNSSFDIVSILDMQEVDNAVNQAAREVATRYDLKNTNSELKLNRDESEIVIGTADEYTLRSVADVLKSKLVRRKISLKALQFSPPEPAAAGRVRQVVKLTQGIPMEKAKAINKLIKRTKLKVNTQIEGDKLRVTSKSKDLLQETIAVVKDADLDIPLQFVNFR